MRIFNTKRWLIYLILLLIVECSIGSFVAWWREGYWSSVENKEFSNWVLYIVEFSIAAILSCLVSGGITYLSNMLGLSIRSTLTRKALKLGNHINIEGGSQRVQEDCKNYPALLIDLIVGLSRSTIMIGVFTVIILQKVSIIYVLLPVVYALIGTLIGAKIARPLIGLNYINQVLEAKFRQNLRKVTYKDVHRNNYKLFRKTKYLNYFQSFYNQITVIIPHLILAGLYFSGIIVFGVFMQVAAAMVELIGSLSFILNAFGEVNLYISCRKRLKELSII